MDSDFRDNDPANCFDLLLETVPRLDTIISATRCLRSFNLVAGSDPKLISSLADNSYENPSSPDELVHVKDFGTDWYSELVKRPWELSLYTDAPIWESPRITALIRPDKSKRDKTGCTSRGEYQHGYELPLLLLHEKPTPQQARRIESILLTITLIENLPKQPEPMMQRAALCFWLSCCIKTKALICSAAKIAPLLTWSSVGRIFTDSNPLHESICKSMMELQELDPILQDGIEIKAHGNAPALTIDDAIRMWDTYSTPLLRDLRSDNVRQGFDLYFTLPPSWVDWDVWEEVVSENGIPFDQPTVGVKRDIAKLIEPYHEELRDIKRVGGGSISIGVDRNIFRQEGENWIVKFDGERVILKNLIGLSYIQLLLQNPEKPIHVNDILKSAGQMELGDSSTLPPEDRFPDLEITSGVDSDLVVDAKTIENVKREAESLRKQADEYMSQGQVDNAEQMFDNAAKIDQYLGKMTKPGGSLRQEDRNLKRARQSVANNIQTALTKIQSSHEPLWRHLKASLALGKECKYFPEKAQEWEI